MKNNARLAVGAPTKNEDVLWGTRFYAPDDLIFLEMNGRKIMAVNQLEYARAKAEARVDEVLLYGDILKKQCSRKKQPSIHDVALLLLKSCGISSIEVSSAFPALMCSTLLKNKIHVTFCDTLFPERAVKTAEELEDIEYAQRSMEEVFSELLAFLARTEIRDGKVWMNDVCVTSEMLRTMFDTELMKRNCLCDSTIIASGEQAANPHCLGYGPIAANTPIVFDMYPRSRKKWYWSDMSRTVVKGRLTQEARAMYDAVYDAQARALEMVRPGIDGADIHRFVKEALEERGFRTGQTTGAWEGFFHGTGHGVGLEIHEAPSIGSARGEILATGNVITIEPGLYYKNIGGVRIEDTVLVTETGYRNLATTPKELIEVP